MDINNTDHSVLTSFLLFLGGVSASTIHINLGIAALSLNIFYTGYKLFVFYKQQKNKGEE